MFRAQQNAFDDAVAKATDENLTSENWEYILDVCDKVAAEESGAKEAVAAMIKRLAHRNANVQLYTLELANALSQNCGPKIHRELASRSFTDALLRLAADRNTHQQVKSKILERMEEWAAMFSSNPDFGIMDQAYMKLKTQNPNLQPPSKPVKSAITDVDRQKEEEELQMALALSVKEKAPPIPTAQASSSAAAAAVAAPRPDTSSPAADLQAATGPVPSGTSAATVSRVRALFDFQPSEPGELQFRKGDIIAVLESVYKDWWKGSLRGHTGIFPLNYVEKLSDPTVEELQREAQMEGDVFGQIKNVEKLLTLLSTRSSDLNAQENEEITALYHSTLAIRPKLIELIGKYSQKKDEFTQLNEKFIKARRDYESLLEASMAQPAQPYGRPAQPQYGYPGAVPGAPGAPGGYPPQADQRYLSPRPQESQPPQAQQNAYYGAEQTMPFRPASHSPDPRAQFAGGVPPPQQQPTPQQAPPADPYQPVHHRPQSTYDHPQELGTSVYDSPVDHPPSGQRPGYPPTGQAPPAAHQQYPPPSQQQGQDYSPLIYSAEDQAQQVPASHYPPQQPPQQLPYPNSPAANQAPSHQPPAVPGAAQPAQQYTAFNPAPSAPPGGAEYQAYQPPQGGVSPSNPASFYR